MAEQGEIGVLHARIISGGGGGADKTVVLSPRFLAETRYRGYAAFAHLPGDDAFEVIRQRARQEDCPLIEIEDDTRLGKPTLERLDRACEEHDIRIFHGHDYKTNLLGLQLRRRRPELKLVTTAHGWVTRSLKLEVYYALDRWAMRRYDQVVAVSQDLYDACRRARIPEARLQLIKNGVDADDFRREHPPAEAPGRDAPPGRLVVGAMGRLSGEKGFDLLIDAVARLVREGVDVEARIAGEGPDEAALRDRIEAADLTDRVKLLGFQSDIRRLYETFDLFCLSSRREGLPNVVLESMSMETPVLATRCGGMEAFARDGEDMLLVPVDDLDALTDGLRRLLSDSALRERLAATARDRVERELSFRRRMEKMVQVYDSLDL